jgi:hypothetical protein
MLEQSKALLKAEKVVGMKSNLNYSLKRSNMAWTHLMATNTNKESLQATLDNKGSEHFNNHYYLI